MDGSLKLWVLDVGHGDSLIIEFPDGFSYAIVDCHLFPAANRRCPRARARTEPKALTWFRDRVADTSRKKPVVKFATLSHPHADHYLGFADLLAGLEELGVPVERFWDTGVTESVAKAMAVGAQEAESEAYRPDKHTCVGDLRASQLAPFEHLERLHAIVFRWCSETVSVTPPKQRMDAYAVTTSAPDSPFFEHEGVRVDVLAPDPHMKMAYEGRLHMDRALRRQLATAYGSVSSENVLSSAFLLSYGAFRLILGGDLTNNAWSAILWDRRRFDTKCNAIKVSHHGSNEGNFPNDLHLWPHIKPQDAKMVAVISGGYRSGNPHPDTVSALESAAVSVYQTGRGDDPSIFKHPKASPYVVEEMHRLGIRLAPSQCLHGDVEVAGFLDGKWVVAPEFP